MKVLRNMTTALTLDRLKINQIATVLRLTGNGTDRRRMMDLGILPGTAVEIEMVSPLGDPTAYRVRGAVVALRRDQARAIEIRLNEGEPS